ncbi:MAG TPA: 50S ribosomal protein L16 [Planctomycetota bacterium]|nr:50S ribosomal protein L16 [Planctomycetota bacterium]
MQMPKRVKFRKMQRGRLRGNAGAGNLVEFGEFGLQALGRCLVTARQIEAGRVAASHFMGGEGRIWVRVFPWKPMSAKPAEVRMGTGKGDVEYWCAPVKAGTILYEIGGLSEEAARTALNRVAHKLPVPVRLVRRRHKI